MPDYGSGLSGERTFNERHVATASCRGNSTIRTSPHITDPKGLSDLQTIRNVYANRFHERTRSSGEGSGITRTRSEVNTRPVNTRYSMPPSSSNTMPHAPASGWSGMLVDDNLPPWMLQTQPNVSNSIGDHTRSREQFDPRTDRDAEIASALSESECDYSPAHARAISASLSALGRAISERDAEIARALSERECDYTRSHAPIDPRTDRDAEIARALSERECDYTRSHAPIDPRTDRDAEIARAFFERECERVGISDFELMNALSRGNRQDRR